MNGKKKGVIISLVVGVVILVLSLVADLIGIGYTGRVLGVFKPLASPWEPV